jgi:FtsP/CotA-like multicopper oxidase with cupredoxin domain
MLKFLLNLFLLARLLTCAASTTTDTLFINDGFLQGTTDTIAVLSFNGNPSFDKSNAILQLAETDTLLLTIWNMDNEVHGFAVRNTAVSIDSIAPGTSAVVTISLSAGAYIYHDPLGYGAYLGLAGLLQVGFPCAAHFFWNIHEYRSGWNDSLAQGITPNTDFVPDLFTVNGFDFPGSLSDSTSVVRGAVGDTLYVVVVNTGLMSHSIHTHGFHGTIRYSSKYSAHVGRVKDSFPILPMETLIIELVPHQPGIYPVHDHNLVAVTSGGNYPGGMISHMNIQP